MSAYGDFLGSFSELFIDLPVYNFTPNVGGGYDSAFVKTIRCIKQTAGDSLNTGGVRDSYAKQGIVHHLSNYVLFSYSKMNIDTNVVKLNGEWYRPMGQELWDDEGGFYRLELTKIIGTTLEQPTTTPVRGTFET